MEAKGIEVKVRKLPDDLQRQVFDYIDFLLRKYQTLDVTHKQFKFDWEGELSDIGEEFTSVRLGHKALEWR
ncbi:MAG: hypothetical protein MAG431_01411 [Chloroflexi bacterium]|nr:hypothetical protein [Chloroflexota bacterium]